MRPEDARTWYRRWYAPNNAYLVVVGDVDHREVFRDAEQTYGALPAGELPKPPHLPPNRRNAARASTVKAPPSCPISPWPGACPR